MRKISICLIICFLFGILLSGLALAQESSVPPARNLTNRISIGYNKQLNFGLFGVPDAGLANTFLSIDSLSTKYWATDRIGMEFLLGYFTAKYDEYGGWVIDLAGKFLYNLIMEDYMNFYAGAGIGILPTHIDYGDTEENETGFEMMGFGGIEFFFQELPNLAFDIEFGIKYIDIDEYAQLSTYGGGFGLFGIRYYF